MDYFNSDYTTKAIDKVTDFARNIKMNKKAFNPKQIELGQYLNGQMSVPGTQTAAANWDE